MVIDIPDNMLCATELLTMKTGTKRSLAYLALVFALALSVMVCVYLSLPNFDEDERQHVKLPSSIEDAKRLGIVLAKHKDRYYYNVLSVFCITYIFLQTFAIPGSIFLSILSGFLFPVPLAMFLVCLCSALGASFCYLLSDVFGRLLVDKYFPVKAAQWADSVAKHKDSLLNYIIFLRITPFLPNWFINIAAPVVNVPLQQFFFGTFIGVAPPSLVAVQAGTTLYKLTSSSDAFSWTNMGMLAAFAGLSLVPVLLKSTFRKKLQ